MRQPGRAAILILAAAALSGCGEGKKQRVAEAVRADAVATGETPATRFHLANADAKVDLALPPRIDNYPELHKTLFEAGRQDLLDFARTAAEDRKHATAKGAPLRGPYERQVAWTITSVSPHLIGLKAKWFADTGGAHPNHGSEARLWDRLRNQFILPSELFRDDYDVSALDQVLCAATTQAKARRMGPNPPGQWTCPKWSDSRFVLVPSVRPYRIGGLMFLFDPYVIGPYAEGDYEVLIPLSDFRRALSPAWAADFEDHPSPDVKPKP